MDSEMNGILQRLVAETMGAELEMPVNEEGGHGVGGEILEPPLSETVRALTALGQTTELPERQMQSQIISNLSSSLNAAFDMMAFAQLERS
jgi:hypothetical protein